MRAIYDDEQRSYGGQLPAAQRVRAAPAVRLRARRTGRRAGAAGDNTTQNARGTRASGTRPSRMLQRCAGPRRQSRLRAFLLLRLSINRVAGRVNSGVSMKPSRVLIQTSAM